MNKIDNPAATIFEKTAIYKEINRYSKYYKHFKFRSKGELTLSYYVIDAFTDTKFGGNPAGVVINENLDEEFMQKFAEEVRFSETAFIKKIDSKNFDIKFFTPTA